ncbi:hypothetical protein B0H12DRAFT_1262689 [Mycena haematopus]|nr:hypothetical protein B0H12DRAFT_1262689 [Mycena haematopus]
MSSPSAKRQRTENAPITRSEPWNNGGSVVLQAANRQFRVHWSVLAQNSSIFRDMQGLPQPLGEPTVDGCPVVELSDDPDDVACLLKALYTPSVHFVPLGAFLLYLYHTLPFIQQKEVPLSLIGALIRLGRKYDFKDLHDSAVACLEADYPTTLERFDELRGKFKAIEWYRGVEFDIVALASEHKILSVLPSAYYDVVCKFTLNELLDRVDKADGTRASLSPNDLRRCVLAHKRLLIKQFQPGYILGWTRRWEFDGCTALEQCRAAREGVLSRYLDSAADTVEPLLPILNDVAYFFRIWFLRGFKFCPTCKRHAISAMSAGRRKLWEELPGMFDLPHWRDLKNGV